MDLEILMNHWGQEAFDPSLMAHWGLDEAGGEVVYDSAGCNDAMAVGDLAWQPEGGQNDGALQFDGLDDYVSTPFVLNPTDAAFSVFAWIKGGGPGQVVLSQAEGANWLMLDSQGAPTTSLKSWTRAKDLSSGVKPIDDTWHRVGFTWDGENRVLYIDDAEVARDLHDGMQDSLGGMYIGAGSDLEKGAFWSGLIDDVRMYNRVISP